MKALLEVFYRPGVLFASLPERKFAWAAPLIADMLLVVVVSFLVPHFLGRENVVRQQVEGMGMPAARVEVLVRQSTSPGRIYAGYVGTALITALILLVISGVLLIFAMMTRRAPRFDAMLSMVSISFFPYWLITTAMTALVLLASPDRSVLDIRNLIATNVAAYMDKAAMAKGLYSLLSSIDILSFGEIGLLSYGFGKLTRVNYFFGLTAVLGLWVLYVSSKMALSLLF